MRKNEPQNNEEMSLILYFCKQEKESTDMKQKQTEENLGPMKLIFNYEDVFYSFFYDDISGCIHRSREYAMNYVYSGEMILNNGKEQIHVGKGECVYIPRDHHITMYKKTADGERYCGIFLNLTRNFRCSIPNNLNIKELRFKR